MLRSKCPSCERTSDGVFPVLPCSSCGEWACLGEGHACAHKCWYCSKPGCEQCMSFESNESAWICAECAEQIEDEPHKEEKETE